MPSTRNSKGQRQGREGNLVGVVGSSDFSNVSNIYFETGATSKQASSSGAIELVGGSGIGGSGGSVSIIGGISFGQGKKNNGGNLILT